MKEKRFSEPSLALLAMGMLGGGVRMPIFRNAVYQHPNAWDQVQLTKAERKGKTLEEIQAMRKEKWDARNATT